MASPKKMAYFLTSTNRQSAQVNAENELINDEPAEVTVENESSINYEHQPAEVVTGNDWFSDEDQPAEVIVKSKWVNDEHQSAVENQYSNLEDLSSDDATEQDSGEGLENMVIDEVNATSEYNNEELEGIFSENFTGDSLKFEYLVSDREATKHEDSKIFTLKSVRRIVIKSPEYVSSAVTLLNKLFYYDRHKFFYVIRTDSIVGQITSELLEFFDRKLEVMSVSYSKKAAIGLKIIGCLILNTKSPPDAYVNFLSHKNNFMSTMIDPALPNIFGNCDFLVKEVIADIIFELLENDSSGILWYESFSKFYRSDNISFGTLSFITSLGIELIPKHSFKSLKVLIDNMLRDISSNSASSYITLKFRRKIIHFYKLWITYCFRFPSSDYLDSSSINVAPDFSVLRNRFLRTKLMHDFCQVPSGYMLPSEYPLIINYSENIENSHLSSPVPHNDFLTTGPFNDLMNAIYNKIKTKNEIRENNFLVYQIKDKRTRDFLTRKTNKQNTSNISKVSPVAATASNKGIDVNLHRESLPVVPVPAKVEVVEIRELSPFMDTAWSEETEGREKIISLSVIHCREENVSDRNKDDDKCDDTDDNLSQKRTSGDMNDSESNVLDNFVIPDFTIQGVCAAYKKFAKKTLNIEYYVNNTANK